MAKNQNKNTREPSEAVKQIGQAGGLKFRVANHVTVPVWSWKTNPDEPRLFRILEPIHVSKALRNEIPDNAKKRGVAKEDMPPAEVARVERLDGNKGTFQMIFGTVLAGNLREAYPNDGYVGKCFQAIQSQREGKRYKDYSIQEIELED